MRGHLLIVGLVGVAIAIRVLTPAGFFSGDEGVKFAQAQAITRGEAALYYSAAEFDPTGQFHQCAITDAFCFRGRGGAYFGTYPLTQAAGAALIMGPLGDSAGWLLSLVAFALFLVLTRRLAFALLRTDAAADVVVGLVGISNALLYATTWCEHVAAGAAWIGSMLLIVTTSAGQPGAMRRAFGAGVLFALACALRTEMLTAGPGWLLVIVLRLGRPLGPARMLYVAGAAGAALVTLAFVGIHLHVTGAWHPTLVASQADHVPVLAERARHLLMNTDGGSTVLACVTVAALALAPARWAPLAQGLGAFGALLLAGSAVWTWHYGPEPALRGLLSTTPWVICAFGILRHARRYPAIAGLSYAAILFVVLIVVVPKRGALGGLELGARYMIPMLPLFAIAAVASWRHLGSRGRRLSALPIAGAVLCCVLNTWVLHQKRLLSANVIAAARGSGAQAVVTPVSWVAQLATPIQSSQWLFVATDEPVLYDRLFHRGIRRFVTLRDGGREPRTSPRLRARRVPTATDDIDRRLGPRTYVLEAISGQ